jgi:hypothetical protein
LKATWLQPLNLKRDILVSSQCYSWLQAFAFKFNSYRYSEEAPMSKKQKKALLAAAAAGGAEGGADSDSKPPKMKKFAVGRLYKLNPAGPYGLKGAWFQPSSL